jgi:hypothetical protein
MTRDCVARKGAQAVMMLGLTYDQAEFLINEAQSRGVGPSAVAREIFEAEIRRRSQDDQGSAKRLGLGPGP